MRHPGKATRLLIATAVGAALAVSAASASAKVALPDRSGAIVVDLPFEGGTLGELISELSTHTGVSILTSGGKAGLPVPAAHLSGPLEAVLDQVASELGLQALWAGGGVVLTERSFRAEDDIAFDEPPRDQNPGAPIDPTVRIEPTVHVFGYARSQREAVRIKAAALGVQETILADDIAEFPELNLAESLQRVPGITITRNRGEGDRISLRGLGPEFTRVQINGMETLANSERNRGFEFNIFASELFKQVDVYKTYDVARDDGGIGGTVNLQTGRPFDFDTSVAIASAEIGSNSNAEKLDSRYTLLMSERLDTAVGEIGLLASLAGSDRVSQGQDASTYRYRAVSIDEADLSFLPMQQQAALLAGEVAFPRGNRYRVSTEDQHRDGITASVQWRPTADLEWLLTGVHSNYRVDRRAFNLQTRGNDSFPTSPATLVDGVVFGPTVIESLEVNEAGELIYGVFRDANIGSESTLTTDDVEFSQVTFSGSWNTNDDLELSMLAGWSASEHKRREDKVYLETFDTVVLDYRGDARFDPVFSYGGPQGLLSPETWRAHEIDLFDAQLRYQHKFVRMDAQKVLSPLLTLDVGASLKMFETTGRQFTQNDLLLNDFQNGTIDDDVSQLAVPFRGHYGARWVGVNVETALRYFGISDQISAPDASSDFKVQEETTAAYANLNWAGTVAGFPAEASIGVRQVWTSRDSEGLALVTDADPRSELLKRSSAASALLPALTTRVELPQHWDLRLAASRNQTAPPFSALNPSAVLRTLQFQDVVAGNPELRPYSATSIDLYAERYWDTNYVSLGIFHKKIDDFVSPVANVQAFSDLDLPADLLRPGQTPETPFVFVTFENSQDTSIQGVEIATRFEFPDVLGIPDGLGVSANYTYANGQYDYYSVAGSQVIRAQFPGLSEHASNASLWYDSKHWGVRGAVSYRSDFITDVQPGLRDEDQRGKLGSVFFDLSAYLNPTPAVRISIDLLNLTGETEFDYSDSARRLTERRESGTSAFIGLHLEF